MKIAKRTAGCIGIANDLTNSSIGPAVVDFLIRNISGFYNAKNNKHLKKYL